MVGLDAQGLLVHFQGRLELVRLLEDDPEREESICICLELDGLLEEVDGLLGVFPAIVEKDAHVVIAFEVLRVDLEGALVQRQALIKVIRALLDAQNLHALCQAVQCINVELVLFQDFSVYCFLEINREC